MRKLARMLLQPLLGAARAEDRLHHDAHEGRQQRGAALVRELQQGDLLLGRHARPLGCKSRSGACDDGCLSPGTATLRVYARACTALLVLPCFTHLPPGACMHIHAHAVLCVLCVHMHMCMHMHMCTHRFIHAHAQCVCCTIPPGSRSCRPGCLTRTPARPSGRPSSICARATRRATRSTVWFGRSVHGARSRAAPARVLSIRIRD